MYLMFGMALFVIFIIGIVLALECYQKQANLEENQEWQLWHLRVLVLI